MLCSDSIDEREFVATPILKLRGEKTEGDLRPRAIKHPVLQLNAGKLENLIIWNGVKGPLMT